MIKRLRRKFIKIAMLAVTLVMLLLCIIVNVANGIIVNSKLNETLNAIYRNQGVIPIQEPGKSPSGNNKPEGNPFERETPYTTRFFVLRYTDSGTLVQADLNSIAMVTEDDTGGFLDIAVKHGEGYGYSSGYKFYVAHNGDNRNMAIFLDCYQETKSLITVAILSVVSMAVCILLVYIIVVSLSRRAIDPVVKSAEKQKQFITDASHELKTPITVIATCLKVLEMENGEQKWIDKAKGQTEKLTELVNSLVTLSKMDEEDSPLEFNKFNISDAVSETAESFRDFAESSGHALSVHVDENIEYIGDEYAVRQLVSILFDNAVKYAADGSEIKFSLEKVKKGVIIRTENECENIDESELDKLFERFYRADKSRNSATGGFGIGLSVARSIAEGHKGSIKAESKDGRHIEFIANLK